MTETELSSVLRSIEAAIEIYRKHEGRLSAPEISVKSMLMAVRVQVVEQLARERNGTKKW